MNIRIFSTSLFCAALLGGCAVSIPAGTRPEIAQRLQAAQAFAERHDHIDVVAQLRAAEAVPNQSEAEKQTVARVAWSLTATNTDKSVFRDIAPNRVGFVDPITGVGGSQQTN
jgi:hypothetical protein